MMNDPMMPATVPDVDFPGQARWTTLVTSAVLGVDRQAPAAYLTDHPLASWTARWADQPEAIRLLREAFVLDRGLLAGQRPLAVAKAPRETVTNPPAPTARHASMQVLWRRWRSMEDTAACQTWIAAAAPLGITIPDEDIPWAWSLGERSIDLRAPLAAVTGPMGAWLLQQSQHPWPYMVRYVQHRAPAEVLNDPASDLDERTGAFTAWAPQDPEAAITWLQDAWDGEKAEFRTVALRALRPHRPAGLDEAWWTKRLTDRSRNVRTLALDALWADPSTTLAQTENAITRACFVPAPQGKLGKLLGSKPSMDLVLPPEGTAADEKRGLDIDPGFRKNVGRRAWMLHERVRRTPPDLFQTWDGLSWSQRLAWAQHTSDAELLMEAWVDAAVTFQHQDLARALLEHPKPTGRTDVAAILPSTELQERAKALLMDGKRGPVNLETLKTVRAWPGIWTQAITTMIAEGIDWSFDRNGHLQPWDVASTLMALGHPRAARALLDDLKSYPMAHMTTAHGEAPHVEMERYWGAALDQRLVLFNALNGPGEA